MSRTRRRTLALTALTAVALSTAVAPAYAATATLGPATMLALPDDAILGYPNGANRAGDLVGVATAPGLCNLRAVRWWGGEAATLDTVDDWWSRAYAVNSDRVSVGFESPDRGDCTTALPRAVSWDADGNFTFLAPYYSGATVATSIDDAGDIVGYAVPAGADPTLAVPVRFVDEQVLPLGDGTLHVDGRPGLGIWDSFRPGPTLTNTTGYNLAFGAALNADGTRAGYVAPVDDRSFIPLGTCLQLPLGDATQGRPAGSGPDQAIDVSADGSVIVGSAERYGWLWRKIRRSGHTPSFKQYPLHVPAPTEAINPVGISKDGLIAVAYGETTRQGYVVPLDTKVPLQLSAYGTATGITDANTDGTATYLVYGYDLNYLPFTWRYVVSQ